MAQAQFGHQLGQTELSPSRPRPTSMQAIEFHNIHFLSCHWLIIDHIIVSRAGWIGKEDKGSGRSSLHSFPFWFYSSFYYVHTLLLTSTKDWDFWDFWDFYKPPSSHVIVVIGNRNRKTYFPAWKPWCLDTASKLFQISMREYHVTVLYV